MKTTLSTLVPLAPWRLTPLPASALIGITMFVLGLPTQADTLTWDGTASSDWNQSEANWDSGGGPGTDTWDNATPDDAVFGATGAGTVTATEAITAGSVTFTGGDYTFGAFGGSLSFSTLDTTGATSVGFDGVLAGSGTITSAVGGNWSGDNSAFNGTVNHSAGTVTIDNANSLGTGIFNLSGGLLNSSNQALLNSTLVINATGGRISALGVNDQIRFTGIVNFNSGGSGVELGGDINNRTMHWESGSTFGGDAASVKIGRSTTFIRTGTNLTYTGDFVIERTGPGASILNLGDGIDLTTNTNNISFNNAGAANQIRAVQVNDGGTVTLNDIVQGTTEVNGQVQLQTANGSTLNVAGDISGGGDLTIAGDGSGSTVFSGSNTYTGATNVTAGNLILASAAADSGSPATVSAGAAFGFDPAGLTDAEIEAVVNDTTWDPASQLVFTVESGTELVSADLSGFGGSAIVLKGAGTLDLSGATLPGGITYETPDGGTIIGAPVGTPITIDSITTSPGSISGQKVTIAFTASGNVDAYSSNTLQAGTWMLVKGGISSSPDDVEDNVSTAARFYVLVLAGSGNPFP